MRNQRNKKNEHWETRKPRIVKQMWEMRSEIFEMRNQTYEMGIGMCKMRTETRCEMRNDTCETTEETCEMRNEKNEKTDK